MPDDDTDQADPTDTVDDERVARREELLAEEKSAGSQDPEAQAEAILAESDERVASRAEEATPPAE